jgi:hypothetical protein
MLLSTPQDSSAIKLDMSSVDTHAVPSNLTQRPRILLEHEQLQKIRANQDNPFYAKALPAFYLQVASRTKSASISTYKGKRFIFEYGWVLPELATAYLISGNTSYRDEIIKRVNHLLGVDWKEYPADMLMGFSCVYDWLNAELPTDLKQKMLKRMSKETRTLFNHFIDEDTFWSEHNKIYGNHGISRAQALGFVGAALHGDDPMALKYSVLSHQYMRKLMEVLPADGAWHEGLMYLHGAAIGITRYAVIAQNVFGENLIETVPWFKNFPTFRRHSSFPDMVSNIDFGDSPTREGGGNSDTSSVLFKIASTLGDGRAQAMGETLVAGGKQVEALDLLWYNPDIAPVPPAQWERSAYLDDLGYYFWRSAWNEQAIYWAFRAGPPMGMKHFNNYFTPDWAGGWGHAHPDAGHVTLYAGGKYLIQDDGYVLKKRTSNHNVSMVGNVGQRGEGSTWFDGRDFFKVQDTARITKAAEGALFSYVIADLAGSYKDAAGINTLLRHVLYLYDGTAVIVDTYSLSSDMPLNSLFHSPKGDARLQNGVLKYKADANRGYFLKGLGTSHVKVSHSTHSITKSEAKGQMSRSNGTLITVRGSGSSGKLFTIIEPIRFNEQEMKWRAGLDGEKLKLERPGDGVELNIDFGSSDVLVTDGQGRRVDAGEIPQTRDNVVMTTPAPVQQPAAIQRPAPVQSPLTSMFPFSFK